VRRQTTIGQELLWLLVFLGIFATAAVLLLAWARSHYFNDRIAIALAAMASGVVTIALRARFLGSDARRP